MSNELTVWGDKVELGQIAARLKTMLPNGANMTEQQIWAAAQYAQITGLDPFAAGFFVMPQGGIIQHYAILVAWAQSKAPYSDKYLPLDASEKDLEGIPEDLIAWKCYILRDDRAPILAEYIKAGMPFVEALDFLAAKGIGIIGPDDLKTKAGKDRQPPKGWTWQKVAQKRALRSALSLSHGRPTAIELRHFSELAYQDSHQAKLANLETQAAVQIQAAASMTKADHRDRLETNGTILHGPEDDTAIGEDEPAPDPSQLTQEELAQLDLI